MSCVSIYCHCDLEQSLTSNGALPYTERASQSKSVKRWAPRLAPGIVNIVAQLDTNVCSFSEAPSTLHGK